MSGKIKILLLGDSNVGKINFLSKYTGTNLTDLDSKLKSLGEVHIDKEIKVENKYINIQIWDTKGQERFSSSLEKYLKKDFEGVILFYDITNKESFEHLKTNYLTIVEQYMKEEYSKHIKLIIVGNNKDLEDKRNVSREEVIKFCRNKNIDEFEVSSNLGTNISKCIGKLIMKIIGNRKKNVNENNLKFFSVLDKYISF